MERWCETVKKFESTEIPPKFFDAGHAKDGRVHVEIFEAPGDREVCEDRTPCWAGCKLLYGSDFWDRCRSRSCGGPQPLQAFGGQAAVRRNALALFFY